MAAIMHNNHLISEATTQKMTNKGILECGITDILISLCKKVVKLWNTLTCNTSPQEAFRQGRIEDAASQLKNRASVRMERVESDDVRKAKATLAANQKMLGTTPPNADKVELQGLSGRSVFLEADVSEWD